MLHSLGKELNIDSETLHQHYTKYYDMMKQLQVDMDTAFYNILIVGMAKRVRKCHFA